MIPAVLKRRHLGMTALVAVVGAAPSAPALAFGSGFPGYDAPPLPQRAPPLPKKRKARRADTQTRSEKQLRVFLSHSFETDSFIVL